MQIKLSTPYGFTHIGKKPNNEDALYPLPNEGTVTDTLFVVCDGVGGLDKGEVASATVVEAFTKELAHAPSPFSADQFNEALAKVYQKLDELEDPHAYKKMGTTLTLLKLHEGGAFMAHIGDSRIYHIRPEAAHPILHCTSDHSLVNELFKAGMLTAEETINHPQRNVITRVVQPHQERPAAADIYETTDLQAGDYLFLCTDGVLEQLTDQQLVEILGTQCSTVEKIRAIEALCEGKTRDNWSACLVPILEVDGVEPPSTEILLQEIPELPLAVDSSSAVVANKRSHSRKWLILILLTLAAIGATLLLTSVVGCSEKREKQTEIQRLINNMVYVEGGTFMMGELVDDPFEFGLYMPTFQVTLTGYSIGKFEVTQAEWREVMGENPSFYKGDYLPVESVSWEDCQTFIRKLNDMTGKRFALPTEAQWEFAARGGNKSKGTHFAGSKHFYEVGWFWENSGDELLYDDWSLELAKENGCTLHTVGQKEPNELGLFDMSGNVAEFCSDWYGEYTPEAKTNPIGSAVENMKLVRGGSWIGNMFFGRVVDRLPVDPDLSRAHFGLRLVLLP